jgi:hypothetical protein
VGQLEVEEDRGDDGCIGEGVGFVEETAGAEVAEHAALNDALEVEPVLGLRPGGFMESGLTVGAPRERAIEDHAVEVKVCVER